MQPRRALRPQIHRKQFAGLASPQVRARQRRAAEAAILEKRIAAAVERAAVAGVRLDAVHPVQQPDVVLVLGAARVQQPVQVAAQVVQVALHLPVHLQCICHGDFGVGAEQLLRFGHVFAVVEHGVGKDVAIFELMGVGEQCAVAADNREFMWGVTSFDENLMNSR